MIKELIKIANELDLRRLHTEADLLDAAIEKHSALSPQEWEGFKEDFGQLDDDQRNYLLMQLGDGGAHDAVPEGASGSGGERGLTGVPDWPGTYSAGEWTPHDGSGDSLLISLPNQGRDLLATFVGWGVINQDEKGQWENIQREEMDRLSSWWQALDMMKPTESYDALTDLGLEFASKEGMSRGEFDGKKEEIYAKHQENLAEAGSGASE